MTPLAVVAPLLASALLLHPPRCTPRPSLPRMMAGGRRISTGELIDTLKARGIDTTGIFEREELLELLDRTPAPELEPIELMDPQSIMAELELRGGDFDVLAPDHALRDLLSDARAAGGEWAAAEPGSAAEPVIVTPPPSSAGSASSTPSSPPGASSPPPSPSSRRARRSAAARPSGTGGGRPDAAEELLPLVGETFGRVLDTVAPVVTGVVDLAVPVVTDAVGGVSQAVERYAPRASEAASQVGSKVGSKATAAATKVASAAGGQHAREAWSAARDRLKALGVAVKPPPKPVLLLLCGSSLKFGLTRTVLAAVSLRLTLDLCQEGVVRARAFSSRKARQPQQLRQPGGEVRRGRNADARDDDDDDDDADAAFLNDLGSRGSR